MYRECKRHQSGTMIDNLKRKNEEPSLWDKLSDNVLLAIPFEWKVIWPPEQCAERLSSLSTRRGSRTYVEMNEVYDQIYEFEVLSEGTQARGVIYLDQALEKTIIKGEIRLGNSVISVPVLLLAATGFAAILLFSFSVVAPHIVSTSLLVCCVPALPLFIYSVFVMRRQGIYARDQLYDLFTETFPIEEKLKKKKHDESTETQA